MKKFFSRFYMALIFIFMYAPILTLIVLSFNASKSRAKWGGFTLKWYVDLFQDETIMGTLWNTLSIAILATIISTFIGTVTCIGLMYANKKTRAIVMNIANIPMINADIVTGISLMLLFQAMHITTGFGTILMAHITFDIPFVMLSVMPRVKTLNQNTYEAALDLGATPIYAFRKAVLPELWPVIIAGGLMAFTMSIDDFIITYFTKGSGYETLSTLIYSEVKRGIQPEIYALSAIIFVAVMFLLILVNVIPKIRSDRKARRGRKKIAAAVLVLCLTATSMGTLTACGTNSSTGKNGKLYVYNWGEYIDPDLIDQFEEETGIDVIYDMFETNEVMYAKMAQDSSAYDVICPSDYMINKMIENDLLQELDFSQIPNAENIGESYWTSSETFDPGNKYSVPYCWGTVGILYNKTMVDEEVNSWDILWDDKYSGQILMQDSVRDALMIALMRNGYSCNTDDEEALEEAAQDLIAQKPLVQAYVVDQVRDKMIGNEAALGVIYSGEAIYTQQENPDLEYVVPDEGTNVWIDSWVISKNSKNVENAHKWINFMCRADVAYKNFEYITYSTPNEAARELIEDDAIKNSEIAFPDLTTMKTEAYQYLGTDVERLYNDKWMEVKSAD
ncbi:spermidine/putrescine transport system permease protein [Lachnospiraceae bacterium A10]|jgi:spermidine/putrescine transport system permease protein|nr:spermidine/putrescine transport system permease protein [Lachnospiraceae bacterium A10]